MLMQHLYHVQFSQQRIHRHFVKRCHTNATYFVSSYFYRPVSDSTRQEIISIDEWFDATSKSHDEVVYSFESYPDATEASNGYALAIGEEK